MKKASLLAIAALLVACNVRMKDPSGTLITTVAESDLEDAKLSIAGSLELRQESVSGLAQELSDGVAMGYYMPIDQYFAHIQTVTPADVQRIAAKNLDPANPLIVTLPRTP